MRHVPEHGEYDEAGQETGEEVYRTGENGVPVTVVVELVVTGQCEERTEPRAQREEHLRRCVDPHLKHEQQECIFVTGTAASGNPQSKR